MLQPVQEGFIGAVNEGSYAGKITSSSFFCILEVYEGYTKEQGDAFLENLHQTMETRGAKNLSDFDDTLSTLVQQANLPIGFSLSAGYVNSSVLLLKTIGTGEIYIKRGSHFEKIISGDTTASGYVNKNDLFVFSSSLFMEGPRGLEYVTKLLSHKRQPNHIVQAITDDPIERKEEAGICLFVLFEEESFKEVGEMPFREIQPETETKHSLSFVMPPFWQQIKTHKKKIWLLGGVIIVFGVLLFNTKAMFGKKQQAISSSTSQTVKQQIEADLKAIDIESGDMEHSLGVISQSRQTVEQLKKTNKKINASDIKDLGDLISGYEAKVLKREVKTPTEFSDLAIEEKGARGDKMSLSGDKASILNKEGKIYILSLLTKSLEKKVYGEIVNSEIVAAYDDVQFFYRVGAGIYKITGNEKPTRIIEDDKDWGNIIDINVYNGNLYVLDQGKDEIYKYLVAENGYSAKNSYVRSDSATQFKKANSLSIDSSVYVGFDSFILKYLSGERQAYKSQFPGNDVNLTKIFTSKDLEQVYALDKSKGIMYVLTKDGSYVKQIQSSSFTSCTDFVVYKDGIYTLNQTKILKVGL